MTAGAKHRYQLARNLVCNQIGFVVSIVAAFFLSPYIVHALGDALYGIWSLIMSFTGHYNLITFGLQGATTRHIAFSAGQEDYEDMNRYINAALWVLLPSSLLCILAGALIAAFMGTLFSIAPEHLFEAQVACVIVSVTIAITFASVIFTCILTAYQHFDTLNLVNASSVVVRSLLTVLLLSQGYRLIGLAFLGLGVTSAASAALALLTQLRCQQWTISPRLATMQSFRTLLAYGVKSFTGNMALALVYQCDLMVIGFFLPPERMTMYSLGATLLYYIVQFNNTIVHVFDPYATRLYARGGLDALRPFYLEGSRFIYVLSGVIVAGCLSFGVPFFTLWIDAEHVESAVILWILVIPQFFGIGARFGHCLLVATARIGTFNLVAISGGIANLILSVLLIQFFGIRGVAVGTLIPMLVIDGIWFIPYIARLLGVSAFHIYLTSVGPGVVVMAVGTALGVVMTRLMMPDSWLLFFLELLLMLLGCGVCACFMLPERLGDIAWKQRLMERMPCAHFHKKIG